jgi:hypothetical protein
MLSFFCHVFESLFIFDLMNHSFPLILTTSSHLYSFKCYNLWSFNNYMMLPFNFTTQTNTIFNSHISSYLMFKILILPTTKTPSFHDFLQHYSKPIHVLWRLFICKTQSYIHIYVKLTWTYHCKKDIKENTKPFTKTLSTIL